MKCLTLFPASFRIICFKESVSILKIYLEILKSLLVVCVKAIEIYWCTDLFLRRCWRLKKLQETILTVSERKHEDYDIQIKEIEITLHYYC